MFFLKKPFLVFQVNQTVETLDIIAVLVGFFFHQREHECMDTS